VAAAILTALRGDTGDVLVFLPGAGEIRRVEASLGERDVRDALVVPLYGALTHDAQDRAIRSDPHGRRKVVLSTSIAETSLTIDGVHVVIDAGLSRVPRFSPGTGMTRLETIRVSRASADQRRGRAGRLGPGVCYRLWPEHEDTHLLASTPPEITSADLTPLALDLAAAGVSDPNELQWLDAPPAASYAQASELLHELSAIDDGGITPHGREMAGLPVHPRLAHMLIRARASGDEAIARDIAALLSERDVFRSTSGPIDADLSLRIACVRGDRDAAPDGADIDRDALRRVRAESERLARQIRARPRAATSTDALGRLLALAYPDRVGQRRAGSRARFVLRNGRGAELAGAQSLFESAYIVAAELDDRRPESRVFLAASVDEEEIRDAFGDQIVTEDAVEFDDATSSVTARRRERLGAIVLRDVALGKPDPDRVRDVLLGAVARRGVSSLPWSESAMRLRSRLAFLHATFPEWPDVSDAALGERIGEWLSPELDHARSWADLARVDLSAALLGLLDWTLRRALDDLAPTHVEVPSGSRIPIDYTDSAAPVLAVRLQEVFGLTESPRIANGRVAVTMHLLSPAGRPVQVTRDLAGFWRTSYFDVRKDMRGRYPKHEWPEDPLTAAPTARAKRRPSR
jgi:ATP-dependent helicase HrpB